MRILRFIILGLFIVLLACRATDKLPMSENEIISKIDLEILSETDVVNNGRPFIWKCYYLETVGPSFRTWKSADPLGPHNVIVTMCDLKVSVNEKSSLHEYSDTRGREISYCNEFMSAWKKLIINETKICISGRPIKNSITKKQEQETPIVNWILDKIKTKKGCYSFWDGYEC